MCIRDSTSIVWTTDATGAFVTPQPEWQAYTGQGWDCAQGFGWTQALHPDDRNDIQAAWLQASRDLSDYCVSGRLWQAESQSYRYFEAHGVPLFNADGTVREWVGNITDRHDIKQAEQALLTLNHELEHRVEQRTAQLVAANQELEAFSYSVSHDLRAPLRSIAGFGQILAEDYGEQLDAEGQNYLARIQRGAQRMSELIDDLLQLSRVTRAELTRMPVDLSAMVQSISATLQEHNRDRVVTVTVPAQLEASGDPRLLRIVLENLLSNAWKFTAPRDSAVIQFGQVRPTAVNADPTFFVQDNGVGFDMAYVNKLFTAFQRLHTEREFPGTGIGLAIVQRIIHRHGGQIWAEGQVANGATFYFSLPLEAKSAESERP